MLGEVVEWCVPLHDFTSLLDPEYSRIERRFQTEPKTMQKATQIRVVVKGLAAITM